MSHKANLFHTLLNGALKSRVLGWILYVLLASFLAAIFISLFFSKELSNISFNDSNPYNKKYDLQIDINSLDLNRHQFDCELEIPKDFSPSDQIGVLLVSSIQNPSSFPPSDSDRVQTCFTFPPRNIMVDIISKKTDKIPDLFGVKQPFHFAPSGNTALYPFDSYDVVLEVLNVTLPPKQSRTDFHLIVTENLPDLVIVNPLYSSTLGRQFVAFQLVRSAFLRMFTVFIYIVAFVILLLISIKEDFNHLLLHGLGYFLALWGLREIISGRISFFPTLVDYLTLALFSLFVMIAIARYLNGYYRRHS
jgi:hypothetical protein